MCRPTLLPILGIRPRPRKLRRRSVFGRHILSSKAEAPGFYLERKTFENSDNTQVLRFMSENLSQLTGEVEPLAIEETI